VTGGLTVDVLGALGLVGRLGALSPGRLPAGAGAFPTFAPAPGAAVVAAPATVIGARTTVVAAPATVEAAPTAACAISAAVGAATSGVEASTGAAPVGAGSTLAAGGASRAGDTPAPAAPAEASIPASATATLADRCTKCLIIDSLLYGFMGPSATDSGHGHAEPRLDVGPVLTAERKKVRARARILVGEVAS
jgi:hypothetical protein